METAGIITIFDENNYGNRLQNYAVQVLLVECGLLPTTIKCENFTQNYQMVRWVVIHKIKQFLKIYLFQDERVKRFLRFNREYISSTRLYYNGRKRHPLHYDYYFVGSDQVWNPKLNRLSDMELLCSFEGGKKISLCASIGVPDLSINDRMRLKEAVSRMAGVSVREESAKRLLEEISDVSVSTLLDPTMLVSRSTWDKVKRDPGNLPKKYILTYFLGQISEHVQQMIFSLGENENYEIVPLGEKNSKYYGMGPAEFIYLIENAECVLTDSFHATVFSILFHTDFYVMKRDYGSVDMKERIATLLSRFSLHNRYITEPLNIQSTTKIDFSNIENILAEERRKYLDFMKSSMQ